MKRLYFLAILFVILSSCQQTAEYISNEGFVYGTIYHVTYESPNGKDLQKGMEAVMNELNRSMSTFDSTSTISKVNKNETTKLDEHFLKVFNRAQEISEITDGAFDVTVAPMVNIWGFGFKNKEEVTVELIDSLKAIVGYQKVWIENDQLVKAHPNTMLDASAIAKGFACDLVANYLSKQGCKNYMVEIGGEVVAKGKNAKGNYWSIGISKPDDNDFFTEQKLKAIVELKERALATSGNYRNFYIENGVKYAHTIDPRTGYPVQHSLLSTTVLADDCMTADAFATAFMVSGLDKSIAIAEGDHNIDVYFIYSDDEGNFKTYVSPGFKKLLKKEFE
ncbi:FAD:protein FMN transferase [Sunxiuqinia dokdonensis]|uniref:FAD:protein FMN transferase n=1 Tax=Sunxiuqinia dokdonensis TaxID=1409788 RepID=A0A0L8VDT9_9BACT|nr:FAD:protein FMN transferase [Sunxiuqinia dokdonensis]KOH46621.1 thiamine biosynthesis protein ApbE [Sunxiuqinia dokdonensis]